VFLFYVGVFTLSLPAIAKAIFSGSETTDALDSARRLSYGRTAQALVEHGYKLAGDPRANFTLEWSRDGDSFGRFYKKDFATEEAKAFAIRQEDYFL